MHGEVDNKTNALERARMLLMTFFISQICAANFGDICNAVGQEATERLLVCKNQNQFTRLVFLSSKGLIMISLLSSL